MEPIKPKIEFYRHRDFGDKFTASFEFYKQNVKNILRMSMYLILPLVLVQGIFMNSYMSDSFSLGYQMSLGNTSAVMPVVIKVLIISVVSIIVSTLLPAIAFTLMQEYRERPTMNGVGFAELKPRLLRNIGRAGRMVLLLSAIVAAYLALVILLGVASLYTLILTIPLTLILVLAVVIPMCMCVPVCIFEDLGTLAAFKKGFWQGLHSWGSLFLLLLVSGLVVNLVSSVFSIPYYIMLFGKMLLSKGNAEMMTESSLVSQFFSFVFIVVMMLGSYIASMFMQFCLGYHYSSVSEDLENTSTNEYLSKFDEMKNPEPEI